MCTPRVVIECSEISHCHVYFHLDRFDEMDKQVKLEKRQEFQQARKKISDSFFEIVDDARRWMQEHVRQFILPLAQTKRTRYNLLSSSSFIMYIATFVLFYRRK